MNRQHEQGRRGFTLVELLVVIAIIAFLAGLAYFVSGAMYRSDRAIRGAANVQASLQIARQMALKDRVIYGVRLVEPVYDPANGALIGFGGLEYVFQPDDYVQNRYRTSVDAMGQPLPSLLQPPGPGNPPGTGILFERDISDGLADQRLWPIQVGDYIQLEKGPSPHLITRVGPDPTPAAPLRPLGINEIELASPQSRTQLFWSHNFRVMRAPRPVPGEQILSLPDDIVIDIARSRTGTNILTPEPVTGRYEFLFSAGQGVVGTSGRAGKIILWVRNRTDNATIAKDQALIVIYTRTASIASYAVNTAPGADPYSFTYDPRPTGL